MDFAARGTCVRFLGATVQTGTTQFAEWEKVRNKARSACHPRKRFWSVKGHATEFVCRSDVLDPDGIGISPIASVVYVE